MASGAVAAGAAGRHHHSSAAAPSASPRAAAARATGMPYVYVCLRLLSMTFVHLWMHGAAPRCQTGPVRWAALFADLEAQLAAAAEADLAGEVADRQRLEVARLQLVDRLRAAAGSELTVGLANGDA